VGAFNLVEGIVDHHLLGVYDGRDDVADPCGGTSASPDGGLVRCAHDAG